MKKILLGILLVMPVLTFAYTNPGKPAGFVNDYAGALSVSQKQSLEQKISSFAKATGDEIAVAVIPSLQGDTIENFAVKLFQDWGIGKSGKDNGVLILVALQDRQMRIEVGYGLEGSLTDLQSFWIIDNVMKPAFKDGDYYGGLNGAVDRIEAAINGETVLEEQPATNSNSLGNIGVVVFFLLVIGFRVMAILLGRSESWWAGGVLGAIAGVVLGLFFRSILVYILVLVPLGLLFDFLVSRSYRNAQARGVLPWWWIIGGRGGRGGGGGFGGFGGGRSGGGGASGGW